MALSSSVVFHHIRKVRRLLDAFIVRQVFPQLCFSSFDMEPEKLQDFLPHLLRFCDAVSKSMLQLELRLLEPLRKLLMNGLRNDSGTGKTNQCIRLSQDQISEARKTGAHPTHRRVCQNRYEQAPMPLETADGSRCLLHLKKRIHALSDNTPHASHQKGR